VVQTDEARAKPLDKTPGVPPLKLKQPHTVIFATAPSEPSSVFVVIYGPTSSAVKRETPRTSQPSAPQTSSFEMVSQRKEKVWNDACPGGR